MKVRSHSEKKMSEEGALKSNKKKKTRNKKKASQRPLLPKWKCMLSRPDLALSLSSDSRLLANPLMTAASNWAEFFCSPLFDWSWQVNLAAAHMCLCVSVFKVWEKTEGVCRLRKSKRSERFHLVPELLFVQTSVLRSPVLSLHNGKWLRVVGGGWFKVHMSNCDSLPEEGFKHSPAAAAVVRPAGKHLREVKGKKTNNISTSNWTAHHWKCSLVAERHAAPQLEFTKVSWHPKLCDAS